MGPACFLLAQDGILVRVMKRMKWTLVIVSGLQFVHSTLHTKRGFAVASVSHPYPCCCACAHVPHVVCVQPGLLLDPFGVFEKNNKKKQSVGLELADPQFLFLCPSAPCLWESLRTRILFDPTASK
jgi:hypothetical protein